MREVATSERIDRFLAALAQVATEPTTVYLVGGATAVLIGWRESTRDIDLVIRPGARQDRTQPCA
jgi:DNA-binding IclR family transcriptional regulator